MDKKFFSLLKRFAIYGDFIEAAPFGSGHINSTWISVWNQAGVRLRYIHQKINDSIFTRPDQVMENIDRVTSHIKNKVSSLGFGDINRSTLTIIPSRESALWVRDEKGGWWRTYLYIEGSRALEHVSSTFDARFLGESIACFQNQLADFEEPRLHEIIPGFHDMEKRYLRFHKALSKDICGRVKNVQPEISFMIKNEERGAVLIRALQNGTIPERICHNDAKINNILVDESDSRALCLIDLDTVMPGTALFDLGDLIRTVTVKTAEDEQDLSKVEFQPDYFEALLDGYLSIAKEFLVPAELSLLNEAGRNITQIMGLRFLTDYLEGDHYYHINRPDHNLNRCRTQIALIQSMDLKWDEMNKILDKILRRKNGKHLSHNTY